MTLEAEGAYIRLLSYNWQDGWIPADVEQLSRLCKCTPRKMAILWDQHLRDCFEPLASDPDKLVNPKLEEIRAGLIEFIEAKTNAGRNGGVKSGEVRRSKAEAKAEAERSTASDLLEANAKRNEPLQSSVSSLLSSRDPNTTSAAADFGVFWNQSTKRGSRKQALAEWLRLKPDGELRLAIWDGMAKWQNSEQWQDETKQPHVFRWLKRRGWEEIVPRSGGKPREVAITDYGHETEVHATHLCTVCQPGHVWNCDREDCDMDHVVACPQVRQSLRKAAN